MRSFVALRITSRVLIGFFALFLFPLGLACPTPSLAQMAVPSVSTIATSKTARLLTITFVDYVDPNAGTNSGASSNAPNRVFDRATIPLGEEPNGAECYSVQGYRVSQPVDYIINPANSGIDQEFVANAVVNAAETWNCAAHTTLLGNLSIGDDPIFSEPWFATNTVDFYDFGFDWAIAQTSVFAIQNGDGGNFEVSGFRVLLNNRHVFGDASNDPNVYDLQGIVAHELGHVVGLGDLYDSQCQDVTMYGYGYLGNVSPRTLAEPDLEGLRQIYGTPSILSDVTVTPDVLCPPNHELIFVTVNYTITNNCGAVDCELSAISNEPDTGLGDGDVVNDIQLIPGDPHHLYLRAECSGSGSGRVYSITVTCTDTSGAVTQKTALVTVSSDCDSDGDGVPDGSDLCPDTPSGSIVNADGCSIAQLVPCDGPASGGKWKSHGQYVQAVVKAATDFLKAKLITRKQWMEIVTHAAWSKCGWNRRCDHDWEGDWHRNWDCDRDRDWGRGRNWDRD